MSDIGPFSCIIVHHARDAFANDEKIAQQWRALNFTAKPNLALAMQQFDNFIQLLAANTTVQQIAATTKTRRLTLDAIYVRDASILCATGAILCRMGKPERQDEPAAMAETYRAMGIPIVGAIESPGTLEGGDFTWLSERCAAVGHGYRTNQEGIRQLRVLLSDSIDELIVVPLPHHKGPGDVFHLMSILSPVDHNLAVAYSPLMPVPFRNRLLALGYTLIEVPDREFRSMGANVLSLAPRRCVMLDGNPKTRAALTQAGATVMVYDGSEISGKGSGGPTCLTRPTGKWRGQTLPYSGLA
jgi:N-dimethylarginine dimethylaminohydrolase